MADSQRYEEAYQESLAGTNPSKFNIIYCEEGDTVKHVYVVVCAPIWKQADLQSVSRIRRMMVAPVDVLVGTWTTRCVTGKVCGNHLACEWR